MSIIKTRRYIVKLHNGCWIATWDGDPGRTCQEQNAKRFRLKGCAYLALMAARRFRPFEDAEIVSVMV